MMISEQVILWIVNIIVIGAAALIFWFIQRQVNEIDNRFVSNEKRTKDMMDTISANLNTLVVTVNKINNEWSISNAVALERAAQQSNQISILFDKNERVLNDISNVKLDINRINLELHNHIARESK